MVEGVVDEFAAYGGLEIVPAVFLVFGDQDCYGGGGRECDGEVGGVSGGEKGVLVELYECGGFVLVRGDTGMCGKYGDDLGVVFGLNSIEKSNHCRNDKWVFPKTPQPQIRSS